MSCIRSRNKGGWKGRTLVVKQQDLQRAVLLGANKVDIYRSTTAASAWAKNTLSDILGWHFWSSWHWTAGWRDNAWDHTDWAERWNHHDSRRAGESTHRRIQAKLSVAIVISTEVLCFQFSRSGLGSAPSPLKDRSSCVCLYGGVAGTVACRESILWR